VDFQEEFFEDVVWMWEVMDKILSWYFGKASGAMGGGVWELGDMGVFGNGLFTYICTYYFLPCIYITTPCTDNLGKGRHHPHMHIFPALNKTFLRRVLACAESYGFLGIAIVAPPPKFTIESRHS